MKAENFNDLKLTIMVNSVKAIVRFHDEEELMRCGYLRRDHSACARGYIHRGGSYIEEYHGKFGNGYIFNHESNDTTFAKKSNTHHAITYYVED